MKAALNRRAVVSADSQSLTSSPSSTPSTSPPFPSSQEPPTPTPLPTVAAMTPDSSEVDIASTAASASSLVNIVSGQASPFPQSSSSPTLPPRSAPPLRCSPPSVLRSPVATQVVSFPASLEKTPLGLMASALMQKINGPSTSAQERAEMKAQLDHLKKEFKQQKSSYQQHHQQHHTEAAPHSSEENDQHTAPVPRKGEGRGEGGRGEKGPGGGEFLSTCACSASEEEPAPTGGGEERGRSDGRAEGAAKRGEGRKEE